MDSILKAFSFQFLLRSIFAGAFFPISFKVANSGPSALLTLDVSTLLTAGLPIALLAGVNLYGVHRSVIYPCIEWLMNSTTAVRLRRALPLISPQTIQVLREQWTASAETGKEKQEFCKHFAVWADYAHLQYASAVAIGSGALAHSLIVKPEPIYWPLLLLGVSLLLAALVSDWRLHRVREALGIHEA